MGPSRLRSRMHRTRWPLLALIALVVACVIGYAVNAAGDSGGHNRPAISEVSLSSLPPQAAATVTLIERGGPFPYPRNDGVVFDNREHRLPAEPHGYYHEYTVPTPGSPDRGARRIITGEHGELYYTGDHYETFVRVESTDGRPTSR